MRSVPCLALATAVLLGGVAAGQMTVHTSVDAGSTGQVIQNDNNEPSYPRYYDYDINNSLEGTSAYSGDVWYQAISALDAQWSNGTTATGTQHYYHYTVDITAPNQCWTLDVTSFRKGRVGAWDDDNRGHAHAAISSLSSSCSPPPDSGSLAVNGLVDAENHDDDEHDHTETFDNSSSPSAARFTGFGNKTITLSFSWDTSLTSTVAFLGGGDEAIVEMGMNIAAGGSAFQKGGEIHTDWGHRLHLELTTVTPPTITSPCPAQVVACVGSSLNLPISASGSALTYQWSKDDLPLPGQTGPSLVLDPVTLADAGVYTCVVSNSCGSAPTCPIVLIVNAPPTIPQSLDLTACSGSAVSWSITPGGVGPFAYQWFKGGVPISAATSSSYSIPSTTTASAGTYSVAVTNPCGTTTKSGVLTIHTLPSIPQSLDLSVCSGFAASWSVTPGGTGPFTYQWLKNGLPIGGANASSYSIPTTTTTSAGVYTVSVTGPCGTTLKSGTLTIKTVPTLPDSLDQSVCLGEDLLLAVTPGGTAPFTYQWFKGIVPISGAIGSSYFIADATQSSGGVYSVAVTNDCGTTVKAGTVTVLSPPVYTASLDRSVCAPSGIVWTVEPSGSGPFSYQWKKNGSSLSGQTSSSFAIATCDEASQGTYSVRITNGCGSVEPSGFLTVNHSPTVTNPSDATRCEGPGLQSVFTVTGTGEPSPSFDWYGPGPAFPFAGSGATLQLVVTPDKAGLYRAIARNGTCLDSPPSQAALLTVNVKPTITQQPVALTVCETSQTQTLFSVAASGTPNLDYRWYGPGPAYPLAGSGPVLSRVVTPADSGSYYAAVTNPCDSLGVHSNVVTLIVNPKPVIQVAVSPDPTIVGQCGAADVTLTANVSGVPTPITYAWFKDGTQVGNTQVLHLGPVQEAGTYWVEVAGASGCAATSDLLPLASGQDGLHAQWRGPDGASLLLYGLWQRLAPTSTACGNWTGQLGALGVCPPPGFGRIQNTGTIVNTAVLEDGDSWTMQQLEIEGGSSSAEQRLSIHPNASLEVGVCATVKPNGVLSLEGGDVAAGLVTVKNGGRIEGRGQLAAGSLDNFGEIRGAGTSSNQLDLALGQDPVLHNHAGAALRVPAASARVRVLGSLENGFPGVASGLVDLQTSAQLIVTDTVENYGLVQVAHSGGGLQSNLSFTRFENHGGAAAGSSPQLSAGVSLSGGKLSAFGDLFENYLGARLYGYGVIDSAVSNSGVVRVTKPVGAPSSVLMVTGCFTNQGNVLIDAGATLVLNNYNACAPNQGPIVFSGPGACVGCVSTSSTLVVQGDFDNDAGAQLQLRTGLVQVDGSFRSRITEPYAFDLSDTRVEMNGYGFLGTQELSLTAPNLGAIGDFESQRAMALGELVAGPTPSLLVLAPRPDGSPSVLYVKTLEVAPGATLELGDNTLYAEEVTLQPGATLSLSGGRLYYGAINLANPCASGQVLGDCATQLLPMPAPDCNGNGVADSLEIAAGTQPDCNGNGVPDACDIGLGRSLDQDLNAVPDDCQRFHADRPWVSASQGGKQTLSLHAGAGFGGKRYAVLGSATGTTPGFPLNGVHVPLVRDGYFRLTMGSFNRAPFSATYGQLDAQGRATAAIELEPGQLNLSTVGLKVYHAFVVLNAGVVVGASSPTSLEVRP